MDALEEEGIEEEERGGDEELDLYTYIDEFEQGTDLKRNTLQTLSRMDELDPLLLKNHDHLNTEDIAKINAYKRRLEKRLDSISSRGNFFEIYRNRNLFNNETFYSLLS